MGMSWDYGDGILGGFFGLLMGNPCRPKFEDPMCCSCRDEGELLTDAFRRSLDDAEDSQALPKLVGQPLGSSNNGSDAAPARGVPPVLQVPPEFDIVRLDRFGEGPGTSTRSPEEQQQLLQMCLRTFARALLRGIRMSVLLDDGRTLLTEASLDSELTHLVLHMPNVQCPVALRCIEKICSPDEVSAGAVLTTNQAYLDERCTTLVLRGGQFLTFVFEASRSREYFEMCLKVVILAKGGSSLEQSPPQGCEEQSPSKPTNAMLLPAANAPVTPTGEKAEAAANDSNGQPAPEPEPAKE